MQMIDEPGGEELAQHCDTATDADVLALRRCSSNGECINRRHIEEMERRTAVHLERWPRAMGQHVRRRTERRIRSPPPAPLRVVLPAWRAELSGTHDLRADTVRVTLGEGVVDAGRTGFTPGPGREHPLVEAMGGVPERRLQRQALAGAEPVERDREVVNPDARHGSSFG